MTEFGRWLGKENGQTMVSNILMSDITREQARAAITTYCLLFNVEVDTKEWDVSIAYWFECYNHWFDTLEEFDEYMAELLV